MILDSTPGSITWGTAESHCVIFRGEWTLEPKFYLNMSTLLFWENTMPKKFLMESERAYALQNLLSDANEKGWILVQA